ncbi:MAG: hypothetical protein ACI4XP_04985 [Acutalibacteraceae bacterium]
MYLFIISFILQLIIIPIILSKAAAYSDIIDTVIVMILDVILVIISSFDLGISGLLPFVTTMGLCFFGTLSNAEKIINPYSKKAARIHIYFWILAGVLMGNIIAFFPMYF